MRDWSALPTDVLNLISTLIPNGADYLSFSSVCTSWASTTPKKLPWLLVQYSPPEPLTTSFLALSNFPNTHLFNPHALLPNLITPSKFICGSSRGWIALLDDDPGISLHNPFTGLHIRLPPLTNLPTTDGFRLVKSDQGFAFRKRGGSGISEWKSFRNIGTFLAKKTVLSSDPSADDCVVMALCYNGSWLIHCRPGDGTWTSLSPPRYSYFFQDIVFYKGKFYAVSNYRVFVCDIGETRVGEISPGKPLFSDGLTRGEAEPGQPRRILKSYLVVSAGDLLLVAIIEKGAENSRDCEVFLVDLDGGCLRLFKLENLGGRAVFLDKVSMSLSAGNSSWCKGNCIYYIGSTSRNQSSRDGYSAITVYDMEEGSTSVISSIQSHNKHVNFWGLHWLTPNLC